MSRREIEDFDSILAKHEDPGFRLNQREIEALVIHAKKFRDRALDQDEPRQGEGGDREALSRALHGLCDPDGEACAWDGEDRVNDGRCADEHGSPHATGVEGLVLAWMRAEGFRRHPEEPEGTAVTEWSVEEAREQLDALAARRDTLIEAISWIEDLAAEVSDD